MRPEYDFSSRSTISPMEREALRRKGGVWARFLLGPALELGVEGKRREDRSERAGHGLMLRARAHW